MRSRIIPDGNGIIVEKVEEIRAVHRKKKLNNDNNDIPDSGELY